MTPQRIQLRRTKGWRKPEGAIVVSRPSKWGNPYRVSEYVTPEEAVWWYRHDLEYSYLGSAIFERIRNELGGHDLACWCKLSDPCHADVLLNLANT